MGADHEAKVFRPPDPDDVHKVLEVNLIGPPRPGILKIGKPLYLGRHRGQLLKLGPREQALRDHGGQPRVPLRCGMCFGVVDGPMLLVITPFLKSKPDTQKIPLWEGILKAHFVNRRGLRRECAIREIPGQETCGVTDGRKRKRSS